MDAIQTEFDRLSNKSNLSKAVTDIDKCIALLENARNHIAQGWNLLRAEEGCLTAAQNRLRVE